MIQRNIGGRLLPIDSNIACIKKANTHKFTYNCSRPKRMIKGSTQQANSNNTPTIPNCVHVSNTALCGCMISIFATP